MRSEMEELYRELKELRETQLQQIDKKPKQGVLKKPTSVKNHRLSTEDDEFQSIENEINRATTNIGSGLNAL